MESEELIALMGEVEAIKVPHALLKLYANSGPVPVTITKNLRKFLDSHGK
jgi:hypothetical protein